MDSNTVMTPSEAIKQFFEGRGGALIFEYEDGEGHDQVVRAMLPAKLGMESVDPGDLYDGLQSLVSEGFISEEFDTRRYPAGISDEIVQPRVMYRVRR